MKTFIFILLLFISPSFFAGGIRDIDFSIDSSNFGVNNSFTLTIYLIKKSGKKIEVKPNEMSLHWNQIQVTGTHISTFKHGVATFNQTEITGANNTCELEVSCDHQKQTIKKTIRLPYLTGIIIKNTIISVNHYAPLSYDLIFSNGKTSPFNPLLFNETNLVSTSSSEVKFDGSNYMLKLDDPVSYESIDVNLKNKLNDQIIGSKRMIVEYPTSCRVESFGNNGRSGSNGSNGSSYSQSGSSGTSGENGTPGKDVKIYAKISNMNSVDFLVLQIFYSDGRHQSEILKHDGRPIIVSTYGGNGGSGGNGGNGMYGYIDKTKQIDSPRGGNGGNGGNAGSGGNGGNVYFIFNNETGDLSSYFSLSTKGGDAGFPGVGGQGGKGNYSDALLLGKILSSRDGSNGTNGVAGTSGTMGTIVAPEILTSQEWNDRYTKNLNGGF